MTTEMPSYIAPEDDAPYERAAQLAAEAEQVTYEYSAVVDRRIHGGKLEIARVRDNLERAETDGAILAHVDMYPVAVWKRRLPDGQWEPLSQEEIN